MDEIKVIREPSPQDRSMFKVFVAVAMAVIIGSLGYALWMV